MAILADFNIVCLNQEKVKFMESETIHFNFFDLNKNDSPIPQSVDQQRILDDWNTLFQLFKGIWYYIYPKAWVEHTNSEEEDFFDYRHKDKAYSENINVMKHKKDGMLSAPNRQKDIEKLITFYLNESPIKRILVMGKIQSNEAEAILGTMTKKEFLSKLKKGQLRFNVAYILKE